MVAEELRTLARCTQESTEKVRQIIERLQGQAREAVTVIHSSQETTREGVEHTNETVQAMADIVDSVANIRDMNNQVATGAEEQSHVAAEINQNIPRIASVAEDTTQAARDKVQAVAAINREVDSLRQLIARLQT